MVGVLAAAFAIVVPFAHLLSYISLLEAVAPWMIELPIYLFPGSSRWLLSAIEKAADNV
jgi:hypothetical protein